MTADSNKAKYLARPWLKFYGQDVPPDVEIPEKSVVAIFDEATERWKDRTAIIFYGRKMSYRELRDEVDRFATALHGLGVRKRDRVALLLLNSPQFIIAYFGALKAGATVTSISPLYVGPEIKRQLEDSGARVIVCQDILYKSIEKTGVKLDSVILTGIGEYLPRLKQFLGSSILRSVYQKKSAPPTELYQREGFYQLHQLIRKYPPEPPRVEFNIREDVASLPYTGGTTGLPKGAMITHYNLVAARYLVKTFWRDVLREGEETIIAYLPFYHIYGETVVMLGGLSDGHTLVIFATPELDDILNAIESHKATVFLSVPGLYEHIRHYHRANKVDWKRIKLLVSGGDALSPETARGWEERTGARIHEGWGMTETTSAGMISPYGRAKAGSFGIPLPNTLAAIVNPEGTNFLPVGETGELIIRGPQLASGYWGNVEESCTTFAQFDGETWLRTCDLARMDEEGYFHFYDRKRDMIKYKGLAVFAREVEDVLAAHPQVKEAVVVGVPDPDVGERVKAVVVLETQARGKTSAEDIMAHCAEKLAHYKIPKIVEFRDELPRTTTGKILRRELREKTQ
jgi:long-chain acyl-CoA synthetase